MEPKNKFSRGVLFVLLGLIGAFMLGGVIGYATRPKPVEPVYNPTPVTQFVKLKPETSDEFSREGKLSPDGTRLVELTVSYRDGRSVEYSFNDSGKVTTASVFATPTDTTPSWKGWYDANGKRLVRVEQHREDGSLSSTLAIGTDSGSIQVGYRADGSVESRVVTLSDGSQQNITYAADGISIAAESVTAPSPRDVNVGTVADGDTTRAKFVVHMVGVRMQGWDYVDPSGNAQHHGEVEANGDLKISVQRWGSHWVQHWQLQGEDNVQKHYTLVRTDEYYDNGGIYRQIFFNADQKTVSESRLFRQDGTIMEVRHYDKQGYLINSDQFDYNGQFVETRPGPTWYKSSEWVWDTLRAEPGTANGDTLYRLRGKAFSKPSLDKGVEVDPIFIP